jgi:hypothetical protein
LDELLEDTGSDQHSFTGLTSEWSIHFLTSLQEAQDSSRSVLTYWETE